MTSSGVGRCPLFLAAALLLACGNGGSAKGSNVVLVTIDTLRARNLGAYGYARDTSPHLDALAREGALFRAAFASAPWTIPSLASLLTSTHPQQHGARIYRLASGKSATAMPREDLTTLAQALGDAGYTTAMFYEAAYPLADMGLGEGFDFRQELRGEGSAPILAWLRAQRDKPFFVWIHFFKPHTPYFPSERSDGALQTERLRDHRELAEFWPAEECARRYAARDAEALRIRVGFYDEAIRDSDALLGEVMEQLRRSGVAERTLVALTSDHGEEFFEHGGCDHGHSLYDELLHVPLVLWHPGVVPAGRSLDAQVRTLDLAPTVLELVEVEQPTTFAGASLVPHLRGDETDRPVFAGFLSDAKETVSLRDDGFKYVRHPSGGGDELYDLRADPGEQTNLVASQFHPKLRELRERTQQWLELGTAGPAPRPVQLDAAERERLRALGYQIDAD